MSKEVGAGGRFEIFLDSVTLDDIANLSRGALTPPHNNPVWC